MKILKHVAGIVTDDKKRKKINGEKKKKLIYVPELKGVWYM